MEEIFFLKNEKDNLVLKLTVGPNVYRAGDIEYIPFLLMDDD